MLKQILASCSLVVVFGFGSLSAHAQQSSPSSPAPAKSPAPTKPAAPAKPATGKPTAIAEEDLKKFVSAAKQLYSISRERDASIAMAVQKEGLSLDRFREIYIAKQNPNAKPASPVSGDEQQKYDRVVAQLVQIQKETQTKMGTAVQAEGLDVPRFLQIMDAIQKTPDLQKKVEQMLKAGAPPAEPKK